MKNNKLELEDDDDDEHDLEILKAVAQAWRGHSDKSSTMTIEFDARRLNFRSKPSRFRLEATAAKNKPFSLSSRVDSHGGRRWDFGQSLWDSYEIVAVSKRIESGLVLDRNQFSDYWDDPKYRPRRKRGKESKNSLRSLFQRMSSRRFSEAEIPSREEEDEGEKEGT